ncbi:MAG: hypothetical protein Q8R02_16635 [Hyphomonadaceae bacterium]|nr:hypothetical protein [Hyphomonadaceae bacterium]
MFETLAVTTLQLARVYGLAIIILAVAALATPTRMGAAIADFERSPGLTLVTAIFTLFLGLALVVLHNHWTDLLAGLVSLMGWVILIKSLLLLAAPAGLLKFASAAGASPGRVRLWGVIVLILGAVFLALGLLGRAAISA